MMRMTNPPMSDDDLRGWEATFDSADKDFGDMLYSHFEAKGGLNWCDVVSEGLRVFNLMFTPNDGVGPVERDSPIDQLLCAIAAKSANSAFDAVAMALGVDPEALQYEVDDWYQIQSASKERPMAIGWERLKAEVERYPEKMAENSVRYEAEKSSRAANAGDAE